MRVYYLEDPLTEGDAQFVHEAMDDQSEIEYIRIPHVLPAESHPWDETTFRKHERLLRSALRNAGISGDKGEQILLVAPKMHYWHAVLVNAVFAETGAYPWLIQTSKQRESIGNPGGTRILDTHGLMGLKD